MLSIHRNCAELPRHGYLTCCWLDHISSLDISLVELLKRADAHAVPLLRARRLVAGCTTNIYGEAEVLAANPRARYFAWD